LPLPYVKGRSAEQYIKQKLKSAGAKLVVRSGRSLTGADLISIHPDRREIFLIQVKAAKKGVSIKQLEKEYGDLLELEGIYRLRCGFFTKKDGHWVSDLRL
jgi:hypothetical protein